MAEIQYFENELSWKGAKNDDQEMEALIKQFRICLKKIKRRKVFAEYFCKTIQSYGFYSVDEETFIHEKALCVLIIKRATN